MALSNNWLGFYAFKQPNSLNDSTSAGRNITTGGSGGSANIGDGHPDDCWNTGSSGFLQRTTTSDFTFPSNAPFSFCMFFKNPTGTTQRALFSKRGVSTQMEYSVLILTSRALEVKLFTNSSNFKTWTTASSVIPNTDTWHHIGISFDGTNIKVYLDAVEVGTTVTTNGTFTGMVTGTNPLVIGAQLTSNYLNGRVDSIGIRSSTTTLEEFQQLYNGGNGVNYPFGSTQGLMAFF